MKKLDYMEAWNDAVALARQHREAILAIAGVFLFLPSLLAAQFLPAVELPKDGDFAGVMAAYNAYFEANWPGILISNLLLTFGGFAIYVLVAQRSASTVGHILRITARWFGIFLLANILTGFATLAGLLLFVLPGLYIAARLSPLPMVIAREGERSAATAVRRAWEVTKGNGLAVLAMLMIVLLTGGIVVSVIGLVVGIIVQLLTSGEGWPLIINLADALAGTAFSLILLLIVAAIYRQLVRG
ncbi:MAG: glycerophosphoryl diester phosphodiesterase membrane domain-containing protein [Parasphingorhabdus sp.]|nr:glycerophosphoryl diester phosphodiesterase membrane domain-containing protein [Parasphingorhabdus sp.]